MLKFVFIGIGLLLSVSGWADDVPRVVVTLKPIHALTSRIMAGAGTPSVLLAGGESPHAYSLRPSQVKQLQEADVLIWVGPALETFLQRPIATLGNSTRVLPLMEVTGLTLLKTREGGVWESHQGHEGGGLDPHIWLDPHNVEIMVRAIAEILGQLDTTHAALYAANTVELLRELEEVDRQLREQLAPVSKVPFLVFHDAYQYFEQHYGLTAVGAITLSPERQSSVKRLHELQAHIKVLNVRCVFSEPQFESALVTTLIEGTAARSGVLDPLGVSLPVGPHAYFTLLHNLADSMSACLLMKD